MAKLVAAAGVPHSPHYPAVFPKDGAQPAPRNFRDIKARLDAARPDAIVVIANDHFNTFFLDNFPTFAICVAASSSGPNDNTRMPRYEFAVHEELAAHLRDAAIEDGFDLAVTQEFSMDHSMLVPLHYLTDGIDKPVVPIWVNAFVRPLPRARRCYTLGAALANAIARWPGDERVAVVATGSFSLEIAGPRVDPGERAGVPDIAWSKHVHRRIGNGEYEAVMAEATPQRMWRAGNVGGELLNWIVMLGAVGGAKPSYIAGHDDKDGHAYAAWSLA